MYLTFPNGDRLPSDVFERVDLSLIPANIGVKLVLPELRIRLW